MTFRKTIFWLHLVAGLIAGVVIGIMSITGVALTYEKEIVAWSERDAQRVTVPAGATRLPLEELVRRGREARPDAQPSSVIIKADAGAVIALSLGRAGSIYVDPYTGDVRTPASTAWRGFMSTMTSWHRYIALSGENRTLGKAITGACNAAFLVLGVTGLYLWWPRSWSTSALKAIALMKFNLGGKARDFNWHNSIGLWSAIPIIIMTATALPISYGWAGALINKLNGPETVATAGSGRGGSAPTAAVTVSTPPAGTARLGYDTLIASVQQQVPDWKQLTLNLGSAPGGGRAGPAGAQAPGGGAQARASGPQPVTFSVREANRWPRTASTTIALDPFTGDVLRREGYGDLPLGRQVRSWTRFLHTGEALGPIGQGIAGLGSLGGVFLMWTGFALSWRRFFGRKGRGSGVSTDQRRT